jgi:hypothetical protein
MSTEEVQVTVIIPDQADLVLPLAQEAAGIAVVATITEVTILILLQAEAAVQNIDLHLHREAHLLLTLLLQAQDQVDQEVLVAAVEAAAVDQEAEEDDKHFGMFAKRTFLSNLSLN